MIGDMSWMKIRLKRTKYIDVFLTFIFVLVIFTPNIKLLPKISWLLAFIGILTLLNKKFVNDLCLFKLYGKKYIICLFLSIFYLGLQPFFHGTDDYSYIELLVGIILTLFRNFLLLYLLYKFYDHNNLLNKYYEFLLKSCCIYVAFTIIFIIFPNFKDFWLNEILSKNNEITYFKYKFRYSLSGFAAFASSSLFSLAAIISGHVIAKDSKFSIKKITAFFVVVVGCFFYGRVSLIGVALGIFVIVFDRGDFIKNIKTLSIIIFITLTLVFIVNYLSSVNESFFIWKEWAFAFIKQIFVEKEITDYSVTHMFEDMYFMPKMTTFIYGDGFYIDKIAGTYYLSTDVGYMRLLLYAGVIGVIIAFIPLLYMFFRLAKIQKQFSDKFFIFSLLVCWLVLEAKGDMYHRTMMILYPIFILKMYETRMG